MNESAWRQIARDKAGQYPIRTKYLLPDGTPKYVNALVAEQSPYLLQHAHNPVDWHPWKEATFTLAKKLNKPVFLSIGYSTCHWCHVMEEESFDDEEVATLLNTHFIAIKVDREQRPDLDEIYMTAVQLVSGQGGWPMSSFLTPGGAPFFGATYFPKRRFMGLLEQTSRLWMETPEKLLEQGARLQQALQRILSPEQKGASFDPNLPGVLAEKLIEMADRRYGGFSDAPKFPQEPFLLFLLDRVQRSPLSLSDNTEWSVVRKALYAMLQGGIFDQVAGGFHRYTVDANWLVPHFEKMLYNQAQLLRCYSQAYQLSGEPDFLRVVEMTANYLEREMLSPEGTFYSATDADSEGQEGTYFVWSWQVLESLLEKDMFAFARQVYGVSRTGNFEGCNILHLAHPPSVLADRLELSYAEFLEKLGRLNETLLQYRSSRPPPLTDTKALTEWNAMLVAALAEAGRLCDNIALQQLAEQVAEKLWKYHRQSNGQLFRLLLEGEPDEQAVLEDYAHMLEALAQLYEIRRDHLWLERAQSLLDILIENHWDSAQGGFFASIEQSEGPLLVRGKNLADNASICGNSQLMHTLAGLQQRTASPELLTLLEAQMQAFSAQARKYPLSAPIFLKGVAEYQTPNPSLPQHLEGGAITVEARFRERYYATVQELDSGLVREIEVLVQVREGWHIQSHQSTDRQGQRTVLSLADGSPHQCLDIRYPEEQRWESCGKTLSVYGEDCRILITVQCQSAAPVRLGLQLQACNETACHRPHFRELSLWPWQVVSEVP